MMERNSFCGFPKIQDLFLLNTRPMDDNCLMDDRIPVTAKTMKRLEENKENKENNRFQENERRKDPWIE